MTEKGGVQSVERIFQLIEQLASHPAGASLQRLAQIFFIQGSAV